MQKIRTSFIARPKKVSKNRFLYWNKYHFTRTYVAAYNAVIGYATKEERGDKQMKMRTINEAHAELLAIDPSCCLTKTALRRLLVTGAVPSVRVGQKYLVSMEALEHYLSCPEVKS